MTWCNLTKAAPGLEKQKDLNWGFGLLVRSSENISRQKAFFPHHGIMSMPAYIVAFFYAQHIYKIPRCKSASICLKCLATYSSSKHSKVALFCCGIEIAERSCSKESSATCSFECKDVSKAIRARTRIEYQEGCVVEGFGQAFIHSFLQHSIRPLFLSPNC